MRLISSLTGWLTTGLTVAVLALAMTGGAAHAGDPACRSGMCQPYQYGSPDLFQNYYVNPACGGLGSTLYVSPGPIPAHVGHTYFTYQPLMPHEFRYPHHRTYHKSYDDGKGLSRASVHWYRPPFKQTLSHIHHGIKLAR